jgi:hypothetical protein
MKLVPLGEVTASLPESSTSNYPSRSPGYAKPRKSKNSGPVDLSNFDFEEWTADVTANGDDTPMFATARPEKKLKRSYSKMIKRKPVPDMMPKPLNVQKAKKSAGSASKTGNISSPWI